MIPIAAKGNHNRRPATSYTQLAAGSAHADSMVIGAPDETPGLLLSTQLSPEGPLTIHALHARGKGDLLETPDRPACRLNDPAEQKNLPLGIRVSKDHVEPGFHLMPRHFRWFQQVLARTAAAGVAAFAGDAMVAARYLTERQRNGDRGDSIAHAAAGSVRDAGYGLLGMDFVGTDHVFRLNNKRVEAFSGVETGLFDLLSAEGGGVEEYRKAIFAQRGNWPQETWDESWGGPVSVQDDGTVLAIRALPTCDH